MGFRTSVSSIRIPAVTDGVLKALHASGDRSITLAPETGGDELRARMGKPVTNRMLLEKIRMIFESGFTQLKLYFIVGQPDESIDDVMAIAELASDADTRGRNPPLKCHEESVLTFSCGCFLGGVGADGCRTDCPET